MSRGLDAMRRCLAPGSTRALVLSASLALAGCGGATAEAAPAQATAARAAPSSQAQRQQALYAFAERLFVALREGEPAELVFDDLTLRRLLNGPAASRASTLRHGMRRRAGVVPVGFEQLRGARFVSACFQGVREEPVGTLLGLTQPGWVFERVLVVGQEPIGRIAAWVEGEFLWTDAGFGALAIHEIETPRRGHADLELAVCDVDLGVHRPLDIVSAGTQTH